MTFLIYFATKLILLKEFIFKIKMIKMISLNHSELPLIFVLANWSRVLLLIRLLV